MKHLEGEVIHIEIDPEKSLKNRTLSNLVNIDDIIVLKQPTDEELVLENVDKILFNQDEFIISNFRFGELHGFSSEGEYTGRIGEVGDGPGRYQSFNDIALMDKNVLVLSNDERKIFEFNKAHQFLSSSQLDFFNNRFVFSDDKFYHFINHNVTEKSFNLLVCNLDNKIEMTAFPFDSKLKNSGISFAGIITHGDKSILFNESFSDTIFSIQNAEITPKFKLNYVNKIPDNEKKDFTLLFRNLISYSFLRNYLVETNNSLHFNSQVNGKLHNSIFNKKSGDTYTYSTNSSDDFLEKIITPPLGNNGNKVLYSIKTELIDYFIDKYPASYEKLKASNLQLWSTIDANRTGLLPIIIVVSDVD